MTAEFQEIDLRIPEELSGQRLDSALARLMPDQSRTRIKTWIESGQVHMDRPRCKPRDVVLAGEHVRVRMAIAAPRLEVAAESIPLTVIHEDADVLVVNKPAGLVVHPGAGNRNHTLQNALLGREPALASLPRAGIVHRLDKDTSGLLVVARTQEAHTSLTRQLAARNVAREYLAVCVGVMTGGGTVDQPIGRHRRDRVRMTVRQDGRAALTQYRVLERFRAHTYLNVTLATGRTHQIRVHLSHVRYPLAGDPVYGGRSGHPKGASERLRAALRDFRRQALHAARLSFDHPRSGERLSLQAPVPDDFARLLLALREDAALRSGAHPG